MSDNYRVFKFGGSSVGTSDAILQAARIAAADHRSLAVVVSAMSGVTDLLLGAAEAASAGHEERARQCISEYAEKHHQVIRDLVKGQAPAAMLTSLAVESVNELAELCRGLAILGENTPRVKDMAAARGERMLAIIFCTLLQGMGIDARYVDAAELIVMERRQGTLIPDLVQSEALISGKLGPMLEAGMTVIIPGFIGRGPENEVVTLGRGGSDLSAAIIGRGLGARQVTLYKEVEGLMTADPRYVKGARVLASLHYREAAELAYYGAKVLHPRTMIPLMDRNIPLCVRSTFDPSARGTLIAGDIKPGPYPVKALTAITGQALISVEGRGMLGVPGIAGRTFAALAQAGLSVSVISQTSSELSICFVVPGGEARLAVEAVEDCFALERQAGMIDAVKSDGPVAVVAVVGLGMRGTPGVAARVFSALSRAGVNVAAIAQGASELNISVVVNQDDVPASLQALHHEFRLDKIHALPARPDRDIAVAVLGLGSIGSNLLEQLVRQRQDLNQRLQLTWHCVAAADSSGLVVSSGGFGIDGLLEMLQAKVSGKSLQGAGSPRLDIEGMLHQMRDRLWPLPLSRAVLVDCTAGDTAPIILEALQQGFHAVLANKKVLTVSQADYQRLFDTARERGVSLRYEATVGAGLPVLDTLAKLRDAGDEIRLILGCFSGTLGYLMTAIENGIPFSEAVGQARSKGYTEPDPRDDLSGIDVARKALILARAMGRSLELSDIQVESLVPDAMRGGTADQFMTELSGLDHDYAGLVARASKRGKVLRYAARIGDGRVKVGLEEVPRDSSLGMLKGTDNQIVFQTARYDLNPLVLTGPGAGPAVTAAGVLNDIVAVATGQDLRPGSGTDLAGVPSGYRQLTAINRE